MSEIEKFWIVRDPSSVSELSDVFFEWPASRLANLIVGTGADLWDDENTKLYSDRGAIKGLIHRT